MIILTNSSVMITIAQFGNGGDTINYFVSPHDGDVIVIMTRKI